ncbi:MAG TPA: hypothetical protein VF544_03820 [Pyrinomonadaceae bacterium]|jgi:hypothetical protein
MEKETTTTIVAEPLQDVPAPVIVDLGSRSKKSINRLKNGEGKLMTEVALAIDQARASLPDEDKDKQIIPVLIIYKQKRRKRSGSGLLPFSPLNPLNFLR